MTTNEKLLPEDYGTFGYLDTRQIARREYQLLALFHFDDKLKFGRIEVQAGFITDYASIDLLYKCFLWLFYAFLVGYGDNAATVHDWIYRGNGFRREDGRMYYPSRKECDDIFYRALKAEGVDEVRAKMFYWGVRLFGESSYVRLQATA